MNFYYHQSSYSNFTYYYPRPIYEKINNFIKNINPLDALIKKKYIPLEVYNFIIHVRDFERTSGWSFVQISDEYIIRNKNNNNKQ